MKDVTFDLQARVGLSILFMGFILAAMLNNSVLFIVGGVFYGMLFLLNPVVPQDLLMVKNADKIIRLSGIIIIALSLITLFNI